MSDPGTDRPTAQRPNLLFIMADDHATHALSAYDATLTKTPNLDRLAHEGMRFDNCFCTNALCTPSRATILTGTYNHVNGVTTLETHFDARQPTFPGLIRDAGYRTAMIGKWHLGHGGIHDPRGFDRWAILPGQGDYHDPILIEEGIRQRHAGYVTEILTDLSIEWMERQRHRDGPFALLLHHKAPHRPWDPPTNDRPANPGGDRPRPATFDDDHAGHAPAAREARMGMMDLDQRDLKAPVPSGLDEQAELAWRWGRFIDDYLACVGAIDVEVGRILDWLDDTGLADDTVVVYTSDQGFFLGDHGWFDKRFMFEESLRMPLLVRHPRRIAPGSVSDEIVLNVDFAPTFLDLAHVPVPFWMQGHSLIPVLEGESPSDWRTEMYYRYWMHLDPDHNVQAHYGIRTHDHKLVYYPGTPIDLPGARPESREPAWELFDLVEDPWELTSVHDAPAYQDVRRDLTDRLWRLQAELGDRP